MDESKTPVSPEVAVVEPVPTPAPVVPVAVPSVGVAPISPNLQSQLDAANKRIEGLVNLLVFFRDNVVIQNEKHIALINSAIR